MRAIFDVNILIRLTFGSVAVARLLRHANDGKFTLLVADLLTDELATTARKPRLADRVERVAYEELVAFLKEEGEFVTLTQPFPFCRDPDDGYLLALARDGRADYLITNDRDLLSLSPFGNCLVVTPEAFQQTLGG